MSSNIKAVATVAGNDENSALIKADDEKHFELMQRQAKALSMSELVPEKFRGKVADCMIAIELAQRMRLPAPIVLQNIVIVKGNPTFSAKFLIAGINSSGKYKSALKYQFNDDRTSCYCYAYDNDGDKITGPSVSLQMANDEGWSAPSKNKYTGAIIKSKWQTMPELMLMYRAAAFFSRVNDPEKSLGFLTAEEITDISLTEEAPAVYSETMQSLGTIEQRVKNRASATDKEPKPENNNGVESGKDEYIAEWSSASHEDRLARFQHLRKVTNFSFAKSKVCITSKPKVTSFAQLEKKAEIAASLLWEMEQMDKIK